MSDTIGDDFHYQVILDLYNMVEHILFASEGCGFVSRTTLSAERVSKFVSLGKVERDFLFGGRYGNLLVNAWNYSLKKLETYKTTEGFEKHQAYDFLRLFFVLIVVTWHEVCDNETAEIAQKKRMVVVHPTSFVIDWLNLKSILNCCDENQIETALMSELKKFI